MGGERERERERENAVLAELSKTISQSLPQGTSVITDLGPDYSFPLHLSTTDLRPDMVWWKDKTKTATLLELTISFDTLLDDAAKRKEAQKPNTGLTFLCVCVCHVFLCVVPNYCALCSWHSLTTLFGFHHPFIVNSPVVDEEFKERERERLWRKMWVKDG